MDNIIPKEIITGMNNSVQGKTTGFSRPLEAIMADRMRATTSIPRPDAIPSPTLPPTAPQEYVKVDGYSLPLNSDVMLMYIFAAVLSKNPEVRKVLDAFKFKFADIHGDLIYPKQTTKKAKRKKKKTK